MTDEEMADKYVIDTGNNDCTIEAFLAGLKAGRPKWHKVADGDLPKDEKAEMMSVEEQLEYAKSIIQDLLDNSDEYARERAIDFLEEG